MCFSSQTHKWFKKFPRMLVGETCLWSVDADSHKWRPVVFCCVVHHWLPVLSIHQWGAASFTQWIENGPNNRDGPGTYFSYCKYFKTSEVKKRFLSFKMFFSSADGELKFWPPMTRRVLLRSILNMLLCGYLMLINNKRQWTLVSGKWTNLEAAHTWTDQQRKMRPLLPCRAICLGLLFSLIILYLKVVEW